MALHTRASTVAWPPFRPLETLTARTADILMADSQRFLATQGGTLSTRLVTP